MIHEACVIIHEVIHVLYAHLISLFVLQYTIVGVKPGKGHLPIWNVYKRGDYAENRVIV